MFAALNKLYRSEINLQKFQIELEFGMEDLSFQTGLNLGWVELQFAAVGEGENEGVVK